MSEISNNTFEPIHQIQVDVDLEEAHSKRENAETLADEIEAEEKIESLESQKIFSPDWGHEFGEVRDLLSF